MTANDIARVDPRGPRFGAAITTVLLALALILGPTWGLVPLGVALIAFGLGAFLGLDKQPWGLLYRSWVRPRLAPPAELEDSRPPRFAQLVGFIFALLAATLNAVFDFCLGCEVWALWQRLRHRAVGPRRVSLNS